MSQVATYADVVDAFEADAFEVDAFESSSTRRIGGSMRQFSVGRALIMGTTMAAILNSTLAPISSAMLIAIKGPTDAPLE
jgi:hypothetical protein